MIEQQGRDATAVHMVGNRERDLGDARLARRLIAGDPDKLVAEPGQQRAVIVIGRPGHPFGLTVGRLRANAEEAQVDVARRHLRMHLPDGLSVLRRGGPDQDSGAVGQQRVNPIRDDR